MVQMMSSEPTPLYQDIESEIKVLKKRDLHNEIPKSIIDNIKQAPRQYQKDALENFIFYMEDTEYKNIPNKHLLFHMATGSGKTNIIASSILYLYEKGYRDFIFFVNTMNIITKTKDNLANKNAIKYLFKQKIMIQNKEVKINVIENNFNDSKKNCINIAFMTTHKIHSSLETHISENSLTYTQFEKRKVVLIADEAHHLNSELKKTKTKADKEHNASWGLTTNTLLKQNKDNILLEFTATAEKSAKKEIKAHYNDKTIFEYPFAQFNEDGFSKRVSLVHSGLSQNQRILQAIMISEYRQIVATHKDINISLKPVVMFKNKTTKEVDENLTLFNNLIDKLSVKDIDEVFNLSQELKAIDDLKLFIGDNLNGFVKRLKYSFRANVCIKIYNTQKDKEETLKLLNSLESSSNDIRVIFAVNVLNEGWDVLNLFDIVKLDETNPNAKSTTSEAQLIGRGARYNPFDYKDNDRYKRKFDDDLSNPLRLLESMYFYSKYDNDYIQKLKTSLNSFGIFEENKKTYNLKLKEEFLNEDLYKSGVIFVNDRVKIDKQKTINTIEDYNIKDYQTRVTFVDNSSYEITLLEDNQNILVQDTTEKLIKTYKLKDFDRDLVHLAMNKIPFYYFSNLKELFPNLKSKNDFIKNNGYLGKVEFAIHSTRKIEDLSDEDKLLLVLDLLEDLERQITKNNITHRGTKEFYPEMVNKLKHDTELSYKESASEISINANWYAYEKHYGTSEEFAFVTFFEGQVQELETKYKYVKLIRNERDFHIYTFAKDMNGNRFEPDYILILEDETNKYQIFIEPKGDGGIERDKWKNEFLEDITKSTDNLKLLESTKDDKLQTTIYETNRYKILGLPFYNMKAKDLFRSDFEELLL